MTVPFLLRRRLNVSGCRPPSLAAAARRFNSRQSGEKVESGIHPEPQIQRETPRTDRLAWAPAPWKEADNVQVGDTAGDALSSVRPTPALAPLRPPQPTRNFSFHSRFQGPAPRNYFLQEVPNDVAKPKLPMWASSRTHPALAKERLVVDNWISQDALGYLDETPRQELEQWLHHWLAAAAAPGGAVVDLAKENICVHPRRANCRGVFARKSFRQGETLVVVPLRRMSLSGTAAGLRIGGSSSTEALPSSSSSPGLALHTESLSSEGVLPFEKALSYIMSMRRAALDPTPHIRFVEQVYLAMQLAVEAGRADGPWAPYLRLLREGDRSNEPLQLFDDDHIKELHRGVLEPSAFLEYEDLCRRFQHLLRGVHALWWEHNQQQFPTPTLETLEWAFRVVLSRQRMTPQLRSNVDDYAACVRAAEALDTTEDKDVFARAVMRAKWFFMDRVLGVVDRERLHSNEVKNLDTMPAIVPLLDLFQHASSGVANTIISYECLSAVSSEHRVSEASEHTLESCAVVRAAQDIEEDEELTTLYPKCYSVPYTLYRYGSLPLHARELDTAHMRE